MKIYFAGSIRGGRGDRELYDEIIELLKGYGEVLTEHIGEKTLSALGEDGPTDKDIYERDLAWLEAADAVVAEVTTPSLGIGYEIAKAEVSKPVLCLYREQEGRRLSAMIGGGRVRVERYQSMQDVERIVKDFLSGVY